MPMLRNLFRAFDSDRALRNARREQEDHELILVQIDALAARLPEADLSTDEAEPLSA